MKAEEYLKERDINPNRVIKKTKQKSGHGIALKDLLEEFASQSEPKEEPTAEGWISVEDDLPKDEKMVIAFDGKTVFAAEYDPNNSCGEYAPSKWYDCEAECFITQDHDHHVTHWMHLPNPPKGLTDKQ